MKRGMFDPFKDLETAGYLRNVRGDKDPRNIKRFEHDLFELKLAVALDFLATRRRVTYQDFLSVHKTLFAAYYPWAGQDRWATAPNIAVRKGEVEFADPNPQVSQRAVEYGLELAQQPGVMARKPGEVMGLFAYGHPFLDGNGRTMLLVHLELCHRAGFSIDWACTEKGAYLEALSQEIAAPGRGILDAHLLQFKGPKLERGSWGDSILSMRGLDGLDDSNEIDGDLSDPAMAEKYRQLEARRGYAYSSVDGTATPAADSASIPNEHDESRSEPDQKKPASASGWEP